MKYTVDVNVTIEIEVKDGTTEDEAQEIALFNAGLTAGISSGLDDKFIDVNVIDVNVVDINKD